MLKKWVEQGLLIKIETGAKKTVKYRLPINTGRQDLFYLQQKIQIKIRLLIFQYVFNNLWGYPLDSSNPNM